MDSIERFIAMQDKIDILEKLLKLKDSEIEKYREVLKEIGCKLEDKADKIYHSDELEEIQVLRIDIHYEKRFLTNMELRNNLYIINEALESEG